jgi:hypothetical protein
MRIVLPKQPETPRPPAVGNGRLKRWLIHGLLASSFAAAGTALLIWPQWIAVDGTQAALEIQVERERELSERLETIRAGNERLRLWKREGRKVFLHEELARYPLLAEAIGKRGGLTGIKATVSGAKLARWSAVVLDQANASAPAGEIRPVTIHLAMKGSFDNVYRTVAALSQQQQLFIPDRWDLFPEGGHGGQKQVRADIWGSVFVVQEPDVNPAAEPASAGALASRYEGEGQG